MCHKYAARGNLLLAQSLIASEMPSLENGSPDPFSKQLPTANPMGWFGLVQVAK
jgi:hypothetical protein